MADLKHPRLIWIKGILFFWIGVIASGLIMIRHPEWGTAFLLVVAIWGFCRSYYFAFYVIEKYIDPTFRFSGLTDFLKYAIRRNK